jgi:L-2,4-diaminobutyrate decarboxylase
MSKTPYGAYLAVLHGYVKYNNARNLSILNASAPKPLPRSMHLAIGKLMSETVKITPTDGSAREVGRGGTPADSAFQVQNDALMEALQLLGQQYPNDTADIVAAMPRELPNKGAGERALLPELAALVLGGGHRLDAPLSFAHMDPPTPWLTWAMTLWNARLNQNLLHPATAPIARIIEERVVAWLAPYFGMDGGHMVPGSTVANLTALWAARELCGIQEVVAPDTAHVSIEKSARLLGLRFRPLPTDEQGRLLPEGAVGLDRACLVLVAGATSTGVIDPLGLAGVAAWTHVDAAWAGPLRLSEKYAVRLDGIEQADSVAVSAHKWLFQPKESALVFFRDAPAAHAALSFGAAYLAAPNIGLLGSHGATAVPLFALLWAWGREGMAARLENCMAASEKFAAFVESDRRLELLCEPETGVVVWRPRDKTITEVIAALPAGLTSQTTVAGNKWLRCVAANPSVDVDAVINTVHGAL